MPFLHDTFTDTDGTLLKDHTPEVGGAIEELGFMWVGGTSNLISQQINNNRLANDNTVTQSYAVCRYTNAVPPDGNYDITFEWRAGRADQGFRTASVYFYMKPTGTSVADFTCYRFSMEADIANRFRLHKFVAGSATNVGIPPEGSSHADNFVWADFGGDSQYVGKNLLFRIEVRDNVKRVFCDSGAGFVEVLHTFDTEIEGPGRIGVVVNRGDGGTGTSANRIDNLMVVSAVPPEPITEAPTLSVVPSYISADLTIGSVTHATSYKHRYRVQGASEWSDWLGTTQAPTVTGLEPETTYEFQAVGTNSLGDGPESSIVTETTLVLPVDNYQDAVLASSPYAFFRFVESSGDTAEDMSGNNRTGTLVNDPQRISGPVNSGLSFNGTNQYVDLGQLGGWRAGPAHTGTVEFWLRMDSAVVGYVMGNSSDTPWVQLEVHDLFFGSMDWQVRDSAGNRKRWQFTGPTPDNEWHHVVLSWTNGVDGLTVVIDGVQITDNITNAVTDTLSATDDTSTPILLGARSEGGTPGSFLDCELAEVAFYDHALSVEDAEIHYAAAEFSPPLSTGGLWSLPKATSADVRVRVTSGSGAAQIEVDTDDTFPDPTIVNGVATIDDWYSFDVTGLSPSTVYYYRAIRENETAVVIGRFETFPTPGEPASFTFAFGSCHSGQYANSPRGINDNNLSAIVPQTATFTRIRDRAPLFFWHSGDAGYVDIGNPAFDDSAYPTWVEHYLANYRNNLGQGTLAQLSHEVPWFYTLDDHDAWYGNNGDGQGGNTNGTQSQIESEHPDAMHGGQEAYRKVVPGINDLPNPASDTGPLYFARWVGRVLMIGLDCRSESDFYEQSVGQGAMLGATQLAWLLDILEGIATIDGVSTSQAGLFVLDVSVPWIVTGGNVSQTDDWGNTQGEREAIADAIETHAKGRVLLIHGDSHMIAIDDGANTQFADGVSDDGPPLFCFAPFNRGNSTKGGPYTVDGSSTVNADHQEQYGIVEIVDNGAVIEVIGTGYRSDTDAQLVSYMFEIQTDEAFDPANLTVTPVGTTAQLSWDASPLLAP